MDAKTWLFAEELLFPQDDCPFQVVDFGSVEEAVEDLRSCHVMRGPQLSRYDGFENVVRVVQNGDRHEPIVVLDAGTFLSLIYRSEYKGFEVL